MWRKEKDKFTILFYRFAEPSYPGQCQHTAVVWELIKNIHYKFFINSEHCDESYNAD